jgi:hypothetical protein
VIAHDFGSRASRPTGCRADRQVIYTALSRHGHYRNRPDPAHAADDARTQRNALRDRGALVWGVGPVFQIPSAANDALGQGKWGAGPTAGVQWSGEQWTFGALINNIWSFAGDASRASVNQMQLQPEINYNFPANPNRYLSFSPTLTANWQASGNERWTVPVSLGIGQLVKIGRQSVNFQATAYYNVVAPPGYGNWTPELLVQFLYPE